MNNGLFYIIEDALKNSRVANYMCKKLIVKRLKNIIQNTSYYEQTNNRNNIQVFIYDSEANNDETFLRFLSGCFQKIQDKRLVYSSLHNVCMQAGKVIIICITD